MTQLPELKIKHIVSMFEERVNNQFDIIPIFDGLRGLSKSTCFYKILSKLRNIKMPFKPRRDILFKREEVIKHLASKEQGCIDADELINSAYNRDFFEENQKTMIKGLNMYRDKGNICGGCVPFFYDIDTQLRKLCSIRFYMIKRGIALVHLPLKTMFTNDCWDTKNNAKIESAWIKKKVKPRYSKLTTAVGILRFKDITKKQRALYEEVKEEKRGRIYGDLTDQNLFKDPNQIFYDNILERLLKGKIDIKTFNEVCLVNGKNIRSVQRTINNMLKQKGEERTYKNLVSYSNTIQKKDNLGFKSP